jgi:uncharacterized lipoprotein YmbA
VLRAPRAELLKPKRETMKTYLMPIIAAIVAAGLAGCASESQYSVQLFKASQSGHVISIIQTSGAPASK